MSRIINKKDWDNLLISLRRSLVTNVWDWRTDQRQIDVEHSGEREREILALWSWLIWLCLTWDLASWWNSSLCYKISYDTYGLVLGILLASWTFLFIGRVWRAFLFLSQGSFKNNFGYSPWLLMHSKPRVPGELAPVEPNIVCPNERKPPVRSEAVRREKR